MEKQHKAQVDLFFLLAELFAVAIAAGVLLYVLPQVFTGFKANPQIANVPTAVTGLNQGQKALNIIPNAIVVIFIMMALTSVILSAFVDTHPVFLLLIIIALPIEMFFSFILHDVFFQIVNSSFIGTGLASAPALLVLFQYLPVVTLFLAVIISIVTFIK